jgi:DNA repair photolyase
LRDDRLVEPILNIAIDRDHFRWYDDELEATLRKCVHALKTINSDISNSAIEKLKELNNENVKYVLEMYK